MEPVPGGVRPVWVRACPMCGRRLSKLTLAEPWRCACGWSTEDKSRAPRSPGPGAPEAGA